MGATKTKAISKLDNLLDPIEKIMLGKRHRVPKWVVDGYETLGKREERLTREERERLGDETSWKIVDLRECAWAWQREQLSNDGRPRVANPAFGGLHTLTQPIGSARKEYDFRSKIREIFADELHESE